MCKMTCHRKRLIAPFLMNIKHTHQDKNELLKNERNKCYICKKVQCYQCYIYSGIAMSSRGCRSWLRYLEQNEIKYTCVSIFCIMIFSYRVLFYHWCLLCFKNKKDSSRSRYCTPNGLRFLGMWTCFSDHRMRSCRRLGMRSWRFGRKQSRDMSVECCNCPGSRIGLSWRLGKHSYKPQHHQCRIASVHWGRWC